MLNSFSNRSVHLTPIAGVFTVLWIGWLGMMLPPSRLGAAENVPLFQWCPLTVEDDPWGNARPGEIQVLLENVRRTFFATFQDPPLEAIVVHHATGNPFIAFRKTPHEPFHIHLTAADRFWSQYSYQFAHEICHSAMNDDRLKGDAKIPHPFGWLQESLCEAASLYTLRRMARDWEKNPPYPHWSDYGHTLHQYAQDLVDAPARHLPDGILMGDWYKVNRSALEGNAELRSFNGVVANRLLPVLEANPTGWQAIAYMPVSPGTLREYFQTWQDQAPSPFAPTIQELAQQFQIHLSRPKSRSRGPKGL